MDVVCVWIGILIYQQNRLQIKMGLQCTKSMENGQRLFISRKDRSLQAEMSNINQEVTFNIKINNLRLLKLSKPFYNIKIQLPQCFSFIIPFADFTQRENMLVANNSYQAEIRTPMSATFNKQVAIYIQQKRDVSVEVLRMKLLHILKGPVKNDHLLKQQKSRLLFDFVIDQNLHTNILLNNFEVRWMNQAQPGFTYFLSLIFSNSRSPVQTFKIYQKHEKIKEISLDKITIRSCELRDCLIKLRLVSPIPGENNFQLFIPYNKLEQQNGYKIITINQIPYQVRQLEVNEKFSIKGEIVGEIKFNLEFYVSKLYTDQMECVILSQHGIVITSPSESNSKHFQSKGKEQVPSEAFSKFNIRLKNSSKSNDYELFALLQEIFMEVEGKQIKMTDEIFKIQQVVLTFLSNLSDLLEPDKAIQNEYVLNIINQLCHKEILKLKYFCSSKDQESKIKMLRVFYVFLVKMLKKIITFTKSGISYLECLLIHKFLAFTFFKFPWCQEEIINALKKQHDYIISEEKLAEIGASYSMKSPSKNYYYDWQTAAYRLIKKDYVFVQELKTLEQIKGQNQNWAKRLFDREYQQLFYGLYSQLWNEAEKSLNNNGKIMWQYFPKYGELLSIFFGEMNNSSLIDFSSQMTKCNMKLIKNEKLLNTFMMLIFPKTQLFETYCVIKCLDLIECYFNVILTNHKKLPYDFHYNYFETGVRCILQSNHLHLLQKMLGIIYKYYNIFTSHFKETLSNFIINKVFCELFLHWSEDVRNIFHLLLNFKILKNEDASLNPENNQNYPRKSKSDQSIQNKLKYQNVIDTLYKMRVKSKELKPIKCSLESQYYLNMKNKIRNRMPIKEESTFNSFDEQLRSHQSLRKQSLMFHTPPQLTKRKWSLNDEFQLNINPTDEQLKYLEKSLKEFQKAKKQPRPDAKVEARSKMLQLNIDQ